MGALRKAGVWLGLIEDDDDRRYDDDYAERDYPAQGRDRDRDRPRESRDRDYHRDRDHRYQSDTFDDEFADEPDEVEVPRSRAESLRGDSRRNERTESMRSESVRGERGSVRPLTRIGAATHDNLALAPQVQLRERAVVAVDDHDDPNYRITTLHPTTWNEARTIGEHFRDGTPVIMNLTEMEEADAKRLVDFAAGLVFGLRGTMERVTNRVFLLSPANVQVTAEDKAKIAEGGFFNQG